MKNTDYSVIETTELNTVLEAGKFMIKLLSDFFVGEGSPDL